MRSTLRIGLSLLVALAATAVVPPAPVAATQGDNYAVDDALSGPRTRWFDEARFGMFIHFGTYAAYRGQYGTCRGAEWIKRECNIPWSDYEGRAATFNPASFDANAIVRLAKQAGQKYIVITAKHHDGFAMWPTKVNRWNLRDQSGFSRDLLRELKDAATANGIKLGFYYSIWDWHDPDFVANFPAYVTKMKAQLQELVTNYDPALLWFDGEWTETNPINPWSAQNGEDLERFVRGISPQIVTNNRIGKRRPVDGDYGTPEQSLADAPPSAQLQETCMTINNTWGYAAWDTAFKSPTDLVRNLTQLTSNGANLLLNIGPTDTGAVTAGQSNALTGVGTWMTTNGTAVSGAGYTGLVDQPAWGRVTRKGNRLYLVVNTWAGTLHLRQRSPFTVTGARVLGSTSPVTVRAAGDGYDFLPSGGTTNAIATVIEADISTPAPAAVGTGTGLKAEFWNNTTFAGAPAVTRTDSTVNYAWRYSGSPAASIGTDNFAGRWTGSIEARYSERYTFTAVSDDTVRLWIDGQPVIDNPTPHGPTVDQGSVTLTAGRHDIRLEHTEQGGEAYLKLIWNSPDTPVQIVPRAQLYPAAGVTQRFNDNVATYSSGWSVSSGRGLGDYNDDVHYTTSNGGSFSYPFTGTGIDYVSERYSDQGLVDIYLDGTLVSTVDTTSAVRQPQQVVYGVRGLPQGSHTLRGVKRSGTYMLVDRFDVTTQ
ncbi:alpha-L-fucosidase [Asanoa sp. NPDC049573]|uniref:alpha-L-fucosidase n=1 Tax=Asanoa sp. NPDC049573 TaxID=3155396 RepID=UPI0034162A89